MSSSAPTLDGLDMSRNYTFCDPMKASSMPISSFWSPLHHQRSFTHNDRCLNKNYHTRRSSDRVQGELSPTLNEDLTKSRHLVQQFTMPTTTIHSSTDPTEYNLSKNAKMFDEISDSADTQSGASLGLTEAGVDGSFESVQLDSQMTFNDNAFDSGENALHQYQPMNATAFLGEHLASPFNTGHGSSYSLNPLVRTQLPKKDSNFPVFHNVPCSNEINQSNQATAASHPISTRYENPQARWFTSPHQEEPTPQMTAGLTKVPVNKRVDSTSYYLSHRLAPVQLGFGKHRRRRSTVSSTNPDANRLSAISEGREAVLPVEEGVFEEEEGSSSQPLQRTTSERTRPKRTKPLPDDKRRRAAHRRKEGNTCLPCKAHRIPVSRKAQIVLYA